MGRQIRLLTGLFLRSLFGFNEFRFTGDKKKKSRYLLMGAAWLMVVFMLVSYVCGASYGLIVAGAGELAVAMPVVCVSVIIFFFTMIKAGPVLFDNRAFEKQIALPVELRAIIVSRFLSMYLTNLLLTMLVMIPGMAVYGLMEEPGIVFYLYGLAGSLFVPLLPLTAASVAGALIAGIGSRWKQKNLAMILLTMVLVCGILVGSFGMSDGISRMDEGALEEMLLQITPALKAGVRRIYLPALWLSGAMVEGRFSQLLLFATVPLGGFVIFLEILRPFYTKICSLLGESAAGNRKNLSLKALKEKSFLRSMTERELRHYFSSVVYVTNTMVGAMMMVILAVGTAVMGKEAIDGLLGVEGIAERTIPVLLGMLPAMMPLTACSISMEGKQWWMMQTFPVSEKALARSKVLADLLVVFPFYLVSELALLIALKPDMGDIVSLVTVPAAYILFSARLGLAINRRFPVFDWENETRAVKQSTSVFLTVLAGMISGAVPMAVLLGASGIPAGAVYGVTIGVLALITAMLEWKEL